MGGKEFGQTLDWAFKIWVPNLPLGFKISEKPSLLHIRPHQLGDGPYWTL